MKSGPDIRVAMQFETIEIGSERETLLMTPKPFSRRLYTLKEDGGVYYRVARDCEDDRAIEAYFGRTPIMLFPYSDLEEEIRLARYVPIPATAEINEQIQLIMDGKIPAEELRDWYQGVSESAQGTDESITSRIHPFTPEQDRSLTSVARNHETSQEAPDSPEIDELESDDKVPEKDVTVPAQGKPELTAIDTRDSDSDSQKSGRRKKSTVNPKFL